MYGLPMPPQFGGQSNHPEMHDQGFYLIQSNEDPDEDWYFLWYLEIIGAIVTTGQKVLVRNINSQESLDDLIDRVLVTVRHTKLDHGLTKSGQYEWGREGYSIRALNCRQLQPFEYTVLCSFLSVVK